MNLVRVSSFSGNVSEHMKLADRQLRGVRRLFFPEGSKTFYCLVSTTNLYTSRAGGGNILLSDFDQKSLQLATCLLSINNNDIIVYN